MGQTMRQRPSHPDGADRQGEDEELALMSVRKPYALDYLVAGITDENCHVETEWGPSVGAEEW